MNTVQKTEWTASMVRGIRRHAGRCERPRSARWIFSVYKTFAFRRDDKVLHAAFDRPDTLNAIDGEMHADLEQLFNDLSADGETNVLVLTGNGRAFSAGGDGTHAGSHRSTGSVSRARCGRKEIKIDQ